MEQNCLLIGTLKAVGTLAGEISEEQGLSGVLTMAGSIPAFPGPYVITAGDTAQTISCAGLLMPQDIVVEAVPSNYGKIAWDGISLSVS